MTPFATAVAAAFAFVGCAYSSCAQAQTPDFSKIEVKTIDLGHNTYRLEGAGGNVTVAVGSDALIMVDSQFAPMHDKLKAAITAISPLPVRYLIDTHFHPDHVGGNEAFQAEGATVVAQDNIRIRLAAGTTNGISGAKTPPAAPGALPKQTYVGGAMTLEAGGRRAELTHFNNAHTDGDTVVYFADANVLCAGDIMNNLKRYQSIDFANGGDIRWVERALERILTMINGETKIMTGHGALASRADVIEYKEMITAVRERIEKLVEDGKSEADVIAARPLKDLDAKWAADDAAAISFLKMAYNSFKRS